MGVLYILVSGAAFGLLPWFARTAYDHGAGPLGMLAARFTAAAVGLIALRLLTQRGRPWPERSLAVKLFLLGAAGYAIQSSFYFYAIKRMDVSLGTVIFYTFPAMVVLAGWAVLGSRPTRAMGVSLAVVVTGAALTAGQMPSGTWTGVVAMLCAAAWYTCYILVSDRITHLSGALTSLTLVMVGASFTHLVALPFHGDPLPQDAIGWWAVIGSAVVSTIIGMGFFFAGVTRLGAGRAAILSTIEPVVSIGVGVVALGETLNAVRIVGAVAVLAGVTYLAARSGADQSSAERGTPVRSGSGLAQGTERS